MSKKEKQVVIVSSGFGSGKSEYIRRFQEKLAEVDVRFYTSEKDDETLKSVWELSEEGIAIECLVPSYDDIESIMRCLGVTAVKLVETVKCQGTLCSAKESVYFLRGE